MRRQPEVDEYISYLQGMDYPFKYEALDLQINVFKNVFPGNGRFGNLIIETLNNFINDKHKTFFDYGCGTGILSIVAAKKGLNIIASDYNPHAIECTKFNAKAHNLENLIDVRLGKSFKTIGSDEKFDLIFAGLPWDNYSPESELDKAFYDEGFDMRNSLFEYGHKHLNPGGSILAPYSIEKEKVLPLCTENPFYVSSTIAELAVDNDVYQIRQFSLNKDK